VVIKVIFLSALIVRGEIFDDWETVWVQHRWPEIPMFRFTAAECDPASARGSSMQHERDIAATLRQLALSKIKISLADEKSRTRVCVSAPTHRCRNRRANAPL
jgi:hypothetical protein